MSALTFSVVSHGHGRLLDRFLRELSELPSARASRVIVTLNLNHDPFEVAAYPSLNLVVIRNIEPRGFGANHNAAFDLCRSDWFVVLNPDLSFRRGDPFPSLMARSAAERVHAIAPLIVSSQGVREDSVRANLTPWSLLQRQLFGRRVAIAADGPSRRGHRFYWLAGMFLLLDAQAFRSVGGFDERFFLYCEDYDLCARLYASGYGLLVDCASEAVHDAQRNSHRSRRHLRWHVESLLKVWTSSAFWKITLAPVISRATAVPQQAK